MLLRPSKEAEKVSTANVTREVLGGGVSIFSFVIKYLLFSVLTGILLLTI